MFSEKNSLTCNRITSIIITTAALVLFSIAMLSVTGCTEGSAKKPDRSLTDLATPQGMIKYLHNHPAVKKLEIWENGYAPGIIINTAHYKIHTTLLDPLMLNQLPGFMESAFKAYQNQLPKPVETETKFNTYLFADRQQWETHTKAATGNQWPLYKQIKKGAYYLNGDCVAYNIGRKRTFAVLGHEGWHQFTGKHFAYRMPSWLEEGISTLFEISRSDGAYFKFYPRQNGGRLGDLKKAMQQNSMIPLKQLIALNPGQVIPLGQTDALNETSAVRAFYAQSYALVRFLREDDHGRRLSKYHNLLLGALNGTWPLNKRQKRIASDRNIPQTARWNSFVSPKLFAHYIDENIENIENQYLAFCKKSVYHVRLKK